MMPTNLFIVLFFVLYVVMGYALHRATKTDTIDRRHES